MLENFQYSHELESGFLWIRVIRAEEIDATVGLLLESFPQLMSMPSKYVQLVDFYQYMVEIQGVMPDMATLVALYRGENGEVELGGTVAVSFNKRGVTVSPPTPRPPKDSPYIYNMTVKKSLRRRRIGWHLLKACEELIRQMRCNSDKVYLHCRMIDRAPFNMYTKAGYNVIKNDNIFVLLTLQRRKYLMCKKMPFADCKSEVDIVESCDEYSVSGISA
ncbi:hypothetical protein GIB67_004265 [Kingdonia uniflora]|uniref:N-acetyltransferase domain-containing protein n=1 Tax=Kingdonia uniflora TaxID=39325 RepID=A0A7J7MR84_9MAGN|nr:hypothetical protein GIB67_004265 [Kingdonia uniflora]